MKPKAPRRQASTPGFHTPSPLLRRAELPGFSSPREPETWTKDLRNEQYVRSLSFRRQVDLARQYAREPRLRALLKPS